MSSTLQKVNRNTYQIDGITIQRLLNGKHLVAPGTEHETLKRELNPAVKYAQLVAKRVAKK